MMPPTTIFASTQVPMPMPRKSLPKPATRLGCHRRRLQRGSGTTSHSTGPAAYIDISWQDLLAQFLGQPSNAGGANRPENRPHRLMMMMMMILLPHTLPIKIACTTMSKRMRPSLHLPIPAPLQLSLPFRETSSIS